MKIILAEDHNIVREGLKKLLEEDSKIIITGEAKNGKEAVELAAKLLPDLILMDISMPILNGIEATKKIKKQLPSIKILVLSMYDNEEYIKEVMNAGANGYLLKEALAEHLVSAIKTVIKGGTYFGPKISERLADKNETQSEEITTKFDTLTNKEKEILKLIGDGLSNKEIAALLNRSVKTIETHRSNIMEKLSIHKLADLIRYSIKKGL